MLAAVFGGPGDVRIEEVPDPTLRDGTDAIVRVTHAGICGSDLWRYRGVAEVQPGYRAGHEFIGIVEDVGPDVRSVRAGDAVLASFAFCDGTCDACRRGITTSCERGGYWGGLAQDGGQGEAVRVPLADGTLVRFPREILDDDRRAAGVLAVCDVLATGHHAARRGGVRAGDRVAVVGDGAVGLCAVLAARRLGAERVIAAGRHEARLALATAFGATQTITVNGDASAELTAGQLRELTGGGVDVALECVGTQAALDAAIGACRPGGSVGYVGVPHLVERVDLEAMFDANIELRGGVCPARAYVPELLPEVLAGTVDPSPVFDRAVDLDGVPEGYADMDAHRAIKVLVRPGSGS